MTLEKQVKHGVFSAIKTAGLKPADAVRRPEDPDKFNFFVRYVDPSHAEKKLPCSAELFTKIRGTPRKRGPHTGLDLKKNVGFILHQRVSSDGKSQVELVDQYPTRRYQHNIFPADSEVRDKVEMEIDILGQINVLKAPYRVRPERLVELMANIDKVARIQIDDVFAKFRVVNIIGRKVELEYDDEDEAGVEVHPDFMG